MLFVVLMLLMGSTNASAKDSQIVNWILVMIIFGATSNPSGMSHMEVLKVYQVQKECSDAITKALSIKMPVAREFRCLKIYVPLWIYAEKF